MDFGDGYINLILPSEVSNLAASQDEAVQALALFGHDAHIGLVIVEREYLDKVYPEVGELWRSDDDTPNGLPWEESLAAWDQVVPGYWCVLHHTSTEGLGFSFHPPKGVELERIQIQLWT